MIHRRLLFLVSGRTAEEKKSNLGWDTFHLKIVCLGDIEEVIAFANGELVFKPLFIDERYPEPARVSSQPRAGSVYEAYSSPGFGGSMCP